MRTHTAIYVSSYQRASSSSGRSAYYYICVLILLYTTVHVSSFYYIFVLILLNMCPQCYRVVFVRLLLCVRILLYMCPHTTMCVLILLYMRQAMDQERLAKEQREFANSTSTPSSSSKGAQRPRLMQEEEVPEHLLGERIAAGDRLSVCWRVA